MWECVTEAVGGIKQLRISQLSPPVSPALGRDAPNHFISGTLTIIPEGSIAALTEKDWEVMLPYLEENERLFNISMEGLLTVNGELWAFNEVYRKVEATELNVLSKTSY
jgi:hypothetical protein